MHVPNTSKHQICVFSPKQAVYNGEELWKDGISDFFSSACCFEFLSRFKMLHFAVQASVLF